MGVRSGDRFGGDRSRGDAAPLVRKLLTAGATKEEVVFVFLSNPAGCGHKTVERGAGYLTKTIAAIRDRMDDQWLAGDWVRVITAKQDRVELCLTSGPHEGTSWWQPVRVGSSAYPHVFRAFGLPPGSHNLLATCGLEALVELNEYRGRKNVVRWLPPLKASTNAAPPATANEEPS